MYQKDFYLWLKVSWKDHAHPTLTPVSEKEKLQEN